MEYRCNSQHITTFCSILYTYGMFGQKCLNEVGVEIIRIYRIYFLIHFATIAVVLSALSATWYTRYTRQLFLISYRSPPKYFQY